MTGVIKFVKRGGAAAATVDENDLASHEWGSEAPDPLEKVRVQDLELPREIDILYINPDADYQQGIQISERQTGAGVSVVTMALPVVMDDIKAKQVADVNHYNAWVGRTTYKLQLSRKWSKLEPTDVIDVVYNDTTFRMRIVKKDDAKMGVISLDCVAEDSAIYTQSGMGAGSSNIPPQVVTIPVQTLGMLLDIPLLRDVDNDAGVYFAACGYRSGWNGCAVFKSNDNGATYNQLFSVSEIATIGNATTTLGNFYGGNVFDEFNTVTVKLFNGSLSSATELAVLNGANYIVLGYEVLQYKTAELIASNTYKLSGLLRGRKGTEWATGLHVIGERFVFASTSTWNRIPMTSGDIGLERLFKFVSFGMTLQQTAATPFISEAVALECYSPVEVGAGRNASSDWVIDWKRRNRIDAEWRDYVDVPMSEATESYEIDIMDATLSTVLRTLTSNTPSVSYTIAQQATDYPSGINSVYMNVYQLSAIVGRGYPKQAQFTVPVVLSSTRWRLYFTADSSYFQSSLVSEIEMRIELDGADQCTGGTASSSSGTASNAFDNNGVSYCIFGGQAPQWIEYQFATTKAIIQFTLQATMGSRSPTAFSLQAYIGTSWVTVYSASGQSWSDYEVKTFTI